MLIKRILLWSTLLLPIYGLRAQQLSLGKTPALLTKSAVLELNADRQGLLLPRLTDTLGINSLNPPAGMIIFHVPTGQLMVRNNGYWSPVALAASLAHYWSLSGNQAGTLPKLGTTDGQPLAFITANQERMRLTTTGRLGIGVTNPNYPLSVKDTMEIRKANGVASLLFTGTSGSGGDFRIGSDGGDIFWQGGGGRNLQMGSFWTMVLAGDRQAAAFPDFTTGTTNLSVLMPAPRATSVPLAIQAAASQSANLTEWRNATNNILNVVRANGNLGLGNSTANEKLEVTGNIRFSGTLLPGGSAGTAGQVLQSNGSATPSWVTPGATSSEWSQGGNTLSTLKTLGTLSQHDLPFVTGGTEGMRLTLNNRLGINTTTPAEQLDVAGNIRISGGNRRLVFANLGNDPDASISLRRYAGTESQELLLYSGNDGQGTFGPDRIRMVAEEFRVQSFGTDQGTLASAENETNTKTRMLVSTQGNVAIGATAFDGTSPERLLVDASETGTYTGMLIKGNTDNYFQLNVKNTSTGTSASSDFVATANNGTETTNFINLGINNSTYTYQNGSPIETGKANDGYLLSSGADLYIVNNNPTKDVIFLAGGTSTAHEAMRIKSNEQIGIGTTAPLANTKLDVNGNFKLGTKGTLINNMGGYELTLGSTLNIGANTHAEITASLPAGYALASTRGTVSVSPAGDLPNGVVIAFARTVTTTSFKVRFQNLYGSATSLPSGTKIYFTLVDF